MRTSAVEAASLNVTQIAIQFMISFTTDTVVPALLLPDATADGQATEDYFPTMTSVAFTATVTASPTLIPILLTEPSVMADTTSKFPTFTTTSAMACPSVILVTVP